MTSFCTINGKCTYFYSGLTFWCPKCPVQEELHNWITSGLGMKFIKNGNLLSNNLVRQHVCRILGWLQEEDRAREGALSSSYPLLPLAALNFDRCLGLQSPVFRQELLLLPLSDVDARTDDQRRTIYVRRGGYKIPFFCLFKMEMMMALTLMMTMITNDQSKHKPVNVWTRSYAFWMQFLFCRLPNLKRVKIWWKVNRIRK